MCSFLVPGVKSKKNCVKSKVNTAIKV